MTIIVFLIDTSASMYQRTGGHMGGRTTLLDIAKNAVETFVKIRQRSPDSRVDRYMLLTFEEPPNNIKAGWKENLTTFMNELKNLQCNGMTTMGVAVKQAFDILNLNRMTTGIDTYGQGRCPFFLETAVIVLITDGGKLSTINGVHDEFALPMNSPIPGSEMTREPFRWDQRLFSLVLRLAGTPAVDRDTGLVPSDSSPVDAMCEVTGGRSYSVISHRMLNQCIDSLVQKVQNGVVINFEKFGPDPPLSEKGDEAFMLLNKDESNNNNNGNGIIEMYNNEPTNLDRIAGTGVGLQGVGVGGAAGNNSWYSCRKMIYVPRAAQKAFPAVGFWPIPEPFWPEVTASVLPARSAHPIVKFSCTSSDPMAIENLPFDKYELEPSPLTQFILARKQPTVCWQVFVANSSKNCDVGHPFGYLKASTNLTCVNLFVMPYHYPVLLPLLDELTKVHRWKPTAEWRTQFQNYMRTLPAYYAAPLRKALMKMGTPQVLANSLIPENAENSLSFSVMNYLKRMKTVAKGEYDKMCNDIIQRQLLIKNPFNIPEQVRVIPRVSLKRELISNPLLADKFNYLRDQAVEHNPPYISMVERERQTVGYRNPFDIPRNRLMAQVAKMRNNFLQSDLSFIDEDSTHSLPIAQMGNYQEYLKRQTPQLREIESTPVRQHMFGNPFKIDKRMMVDEADIDLVGAGSMGNLSRATKRINPSPIMDRIPTKRKPGPLPRNLVVRRPSSCSETSSIASMSPSGSPMGSPVPSPVPWLNFAPQSPISQQPSSSIDIKPPLEFFALPFSDLSIQPNQLQSCSYPSIASSSPPSSSPCPSPNPYVSANQNVQQQPLVNNILVVNGTVDLNQTATFKNSNLQQRSRSPSPPLLQSNLLQGGSTLVVAIAHVQQTHHSIESPVPLYNPTTISNAAIQSNLNSTTRATYSTSNSTLYADGGSTIGVGTGTTVGGGNGVVIPGYSHSTVTNHKYDCADDKLNIREILKEANMGLGIVLGGESGGDSRVNGGVTTGKVEKDAGDCNKEGIKGHTVQIKVENLQEIESQNQELRRTLNKLVRRPGKNFTDLFENIKLLKGDFKMQVSIVRLVINESLRFKRKQLALQLEDYIKNLNTSENPK